MQTPTPDKIAKLPAWAQEYIRTLNYQREQAAKTLRSYINESAPSAFSTVEYPGLGEKAGPSEVVRFIQTESVRVEHRGVCLEVRVRDGGHSGPGIHLQWSGVPRHSLREVAFIPRCHQSAVLRAVEDLS